MRRTRLIRRVGSALGLLLLVLLAVGWSWVSYTRKGQATYNVLEHRVTAWVESVFGLAWEPSSQAGGVSGTVRNEQGEPLEGASVVVSTRDGHTISILTDAHGRFLLEGIPTGWVVPAVACHGYEAQVYRLAPWKARSPVRVQAGETTSGVDFALEADPAPVLLPSVERWEQVSVSNEFPEPTTALRTRVAFVRDDYEVTCYTYEPAQAQDPDEQLPAIIAVYPSDPLNWEPASVAFVAQGYIVLGIGPVSMRDLDIIADTEDLRLAMALLAQGKISERIDPSRIAAFGGSYSSMALMRSVHSAPYVQSVVLMGGMSDAYLLRYDALRSGYTGYTEYPKVEYLMWSLGRPDRKPRMYIENSAAFSVRGLPPVCIIHGTGDAIIPYNQSQRMAEALAEAGQPYELHIYKDTDHYPGVQDPGPATQAMYWEMVRFFAHYVGT